MKKPLTETDLILKIWKAGVRRLRTKKDGGMHSDMMETHLEGMKRQEKPTTMSADGAYFSEKMVRLTAEKNNG